VDFAEAFQTKKLIELEGLSIPLISRENLIKNKRATGKDKDKLDADYLDGSSI